MKKKEKKVRVKATTQAVHTPRKSQTNTKSLWSYLLPPTVLAALTAIFYAPSLHYDFQFDSIANITKHFSIRHQTFTNLFLSNTRWISYWLNSVYYKIGKFDPFFYRLGNLIIHTCNGLFIFFILFLGLKQLKRKHFFSVNALPISFFTAALFLLHPVQTQTVSYVIQGQLEGLAALFILAMALCFLVRSYTQSAITKGALTFFLFVLALFSCGTKEIAIISPALLMLVDWFFVAQGEWRSFKKRIYLHAAIGLFVFGIYLYFLKPGFFTSILGLKKIAKNNIGNVITHNPVATITPWMFFRSQFKVILHYLWMFIWPLNISVEYDWMISRSIFSPDAFFSLLALLGIAFGVFQLLRRNAAHLIGFGALWFFVCLAPRSSIIPSPELLVDYKTYLASFGWLFLLASGGIWLAAYALKKIKNIPSPFSLEQYGLQTASIAVAILLGFLTTSRNTVWRSGLEFWENVIQNAPDKARAYNNYGVELSQKKRDFEGSIAYFQKAISMDKNYADPFNNLAVAYSHLGKIDNAIQAMEKSLKIQPYYPEGYNNMASFYINKGEFEKAERSLKIALKLRPHYGKAYFNLGRIHLKQNNVEKAWECFKNSCTRADFDIKYGFEIYGRTSLELKKYNDAIFAYGKVLQFAPNDTEAQFNFANAHYLSEKFEQAKILYERIVKNNPQNLKAWHNLGETYFKLDNYAQALNAYRKSYRLRAQIPYIQLRMAHCLEKLGKPYESKEMLEAFLKEKHPGDQQAIAQLTSKAQSILAQMHTKYPGRKPGISV